MPPYREPFNVQNALPRLVLALCLIAAPAPAQSPAASDPGLDHAMLDTKTSPCDNFYRFACGGWIDANPIPADESSWRVDQVLSLRNRETLRAILEKAAMSPTPETEKIGNYYAACMDEAKIESLGLKPLQPGLARIAALTSKDRLPELIANLHRIGVGALFAFGSGQDAKNAEAEIAIADQGGMGLPDRDYYLKTDPQTRKIRDAYQAHIARMFVLSGASEAEAEGKAKSVMAVETALAKGALDRVARRDPQQTYHLLDRAALNALTPGFDWAAYLAPAGAPPVKSVDVTEPKFLQTAAQTVAKTSLDDLKTYLTWHLIDAAAPWLPKAFVDENFAFNGKILTGTKEIRPRWKRCVDAVDAELGEDLGRAYVATTFPPAAKVATEAMVDAVAQAFEADLKSLDWMSAETKAKAVTKLSQMRRKIGYPDRWRDYSALIVSRDDMLGDAMRAAGFEMDRELNKIGKPVDRGEWEMTPPTVNAYYDPQMNDINLPAGILQPPFFSPEYDDAINYGETGGGTVGHEMTHGFDDEGRQYDGYGNLVDWWTKQDAVRFGKRAQCVVDQYSGYTAIDKIHINGKLTLGENVADLGGVRLGYAALMKILAGKVQSDIGGFTPAQRYFIGYAQSWCGSTRPESVRLRTVTDPHSPPEYRVNGVVSDMPEFRAAFSCKANAPMAPAKVCRVW
jgi:endothelin-converting enzyme/putative endopeptidase